LGVPNLKESLAYAGLFLFPASSKKMMKRDKAYSIFLIKFRTKINNPLSNFFRRLQVLIYPPFWDLAIAVFL
jgi:hypothetical protein